MIVTATTRIDHHHFLHKRIFKFAKGLGRTALGVVGQAGIPGISQGARFVSSLTRGGSRDPRFTAARATALTRGRLQQQFLLDRRLPESDPMLKNKRFGIDVPGQARALLAAGGETCPKGHHLNKSGYFLSNGSHVPALSRCVKNRRRNNDNGRAAMRAARRLLGRKKSQDSIDRALRAFAPKRSSRTQKSTPSRGGPIVVAS